jgi:hypothetical protein
MVDTSGNTPELNGFPLPAGCHDVVYDSETRSVFSHLVTLRKDVMDATVDEVGEMIFEN